jgi:hypothetical protein
LLSETSSIVMSPVGGRPGIYADDDPNAATT